MNKKQKILAILGLGLVLFLLLTNAPVRAQTPPATSNTDAPAQTQAPPATTPDTKKDVPVPATAGGGTETIIGGIGVAVISKIFEIVNYIIGFIGGILFSLAGGLTRFTLGLNFDILNNSLVTVGWQISRDLANLGFVLFIIIIAIATILRFQQYGAKNTLGKLIAVALLVNFSLVFAGIFIDFSNMLTNFFITRTTGSGIIGLDSALANAFKIQNLLRVKEVTTEVEKWGAGGALGASFGASLIGIASMFFVAIFTLLGAFSLLALAIMFLIRVIALAILLVLVPLACLFVILPVTKNLWDQWWKNFMKWILFAPAASFFLYLSVAMTINYGKAIRGMAQSVQGIGTTDQITFGNLLIKEPLEQIGNMIIIIGFLLGGLIAANSFGITGSKAFLGMAQATGKWARGTLGRMGAGIVTRPLRGTQTQKLIEGMQKTGLGGGRFARAIGAPIRTLGGALSTAGVQQGQRAVQQAEARLKNRFANDRNLALALPRLSHTDQIAAVKRLMKNKTMNLVDERVLDSMIGNKDTENVFKRYGAGKEYGDFTKAAGRNYEMVNAKTSAEKEAAAIALHSTYDPKDYVSLRTNAIISDKDADTNIAAIMRTNPGALAKLFPKLKSQDFDVISPKICDEVIRMIMGKDFNIGAKVGLEAEEKLDWLKKQVEQNEYKKFQPIYKSIAKNLGGRITGYLEIPMPPIA